MERKDLVNLKRFLEKNKNRALMTALGLSTALSLSACSNDAELKEPILVGEAIEEEYYEPDLVKEEEKYYHKEDLSLYAYLTKDGNMKYRFGVNVSQSSDFPDFKTSLIQLVTGEEEYISIDYFDRIIDGEVVQNITNGIVLDEFLTIPDSDLDKYYGIIDLNNIDLPGVNDNLTVYSKGLLENIETILNKDSYDINDNREQKVYNLADLQVYSFAGEIMFVDNSKGIFTNTIYDNNIMGNKEVYYLPSIIKPTKALKYIANVDYIYYEGDVRDYYTLYGVTSLNKEENELLKNVKNIEAIDISAYLTDYQKLKGNLTFDEIVELEKMLQEDLKITL